MLCVEHEMILHDRSPTGPSSSIAAGWPRVRAVRRKGETPHRGTGLLKAISGLADGRRIAVLPPTANLLPTKPPARALDFNH